MKMFSPEEAEARIPGVLKSTALEIIDCMLKLDKYPVNSREVESRILAIQGHVGHLVKLCFVIWRAPKKEKPSAPGTA